MSGNAEIAARLPFKIGPSKWAHDACHCQLDEACHIDTYLASAIP